MRVIPSLDTVAAAAANVYDAVLRGGVADLRPMPSTIIDEGPQRTVRRYLPVETAPHAAGRAPVLLVPPLAAPATCFDLRRGCSVVEHLAQAGRPTYLVDYGPINFSDRRLGLEHWVEDVVPAAIRATAAHAGDARVQLVGWSLGGVFALLALAAEPSLPVVAAALLGTPVDFGKVPLVAPLRPIAAVTQGREVSALYRLLGIAPAPLVRRGYQLVGFEKHVTKPWTVLTNLHDRELLAQIEAVNRFMAGMHAYPGRTFGQIYHRLFRANDLARGRLSLADRTLDLADVRAPVLAVAGRGDGIAPIAACHHVASLLPNAATVQLETAPGGHLGLLTGRAARGTTWKLLDAFLDERNSPVRAARGRRRAATLRAP